MYKYLKSVGIDHLIFVLICVIYFYLATLSSDLASHDIYGYILFYFSIIIPYLIPFVFVFWAMKSIVYLCMNKDQGFLGLSTCWSCLKVDYLSKRSLFQFLIIFPLIPFFNFSYSSLKQTIPIIEGKTLDLNLYNIDYYLHAGNTPWELLQPFFGNQLSTCVLDFLYLCWGSLFLYTLLWMIFSKRRLLRLQFFLTLMLSWIIIGNILAKVFASAGPCYFAKVVNSVPDPYKSMMAYLRSVPELKAVQIQDVLWQSHTNGVFMPLGGISAMPSMHVSIAVLMALVYYKINPKVGLFFVLFAATIQIGSVHLGWHYAIDGYLSILLTVAIWKGVEKMAFFLNEKQTIFSINSVAKPSERKFPQP